MGAACLALAPGLLLALPAAALAVPEPPNASFSVSPAAPLTLEAVSFTSTSTGEVQSENWDLDNDGSFDDGAGRTASRSFSSAGIYLVRLRVIGPGGYEDHGRYITVSNRPPEAALTFFPATPTEGELVNFVSTSGDPDGTITDQLWDLDNDGAFDDGSGGLASTRFPAPGNYVVRLWVVDSNRSEQVATQTVSVAAKALVLATPFPVVRMVGKATRTGVRITRFTVEAPPGATVEVRCRGAGCPRRSQVRKAGGRSGPQAMAARLVRFRRFERRLRAGAIVQVFVTNPGAIGKYTSFRVRRGNAPRRRDLCMLPGAKLPSACPGT